MPSGIYKRKPFTKQACKNISIARSARYKRLGYINSKVTRRKIGDAGRGNQYCLGYKHTKATKKRMSKAAQKRMLGKTGRLSPAWMGGVSFIKYTINFNKKLRSKIRKRDKNMCQLCNKRKYSYALAVHHVDYNKKNCREDNLISLHSGCNSIVNGDRDYWYAYFKYMLGSKNNE